MVVREAGTVESVGGNRASVRLRPARPEACRNCRACQPAGQGVYLLTVDAGDLRPGDGVTVEVALPGAWRAIGLVLAAPLAALVVGAIVGAEWEGLRRGLGLDADTAALAMALGLAVVVLTAAVWSERRFRRRHPPRVIAVRRPSAADGG